MNAGRENISSSDQSDWRPRLRPVEVRPVPQSEGPMVAVLDPTGIAGVALTMSLPALQILSFIDGEHTLDEILKEYAKQYGEVLKRETLQQLLNHLESAHFLEGPSFEEYYGKLVDEYLGAPTRPLIDSHGLGLDDEDVSTALARMFPWEQNGNIEASIVGLIAPHLDYQRGQPCYLQAYSALSSQRNIKRYVILGTNHFGRSSSVVATGKDFETPLGTSRVDLPFLEKLEERCGCSLRGDEFDHKREHSVELQVLLLQHIFAAREFAIVPFICPNLCGPSGIAPHDGEGVDLKDFASALGKLIAGDDTPTCIIAAADLSHVGSFFGDTMQLSDEFLSQVGQRDRITLSYVVKNDRERFIKQVSQGDNPTRICSTGCIYTLMTALPQARVRLLDYHQAVSREMQCCVTCAAAVFEAC